MRSLILKAAALALCACALVAACSPQDGSAPAASSAPAAKGTTGGAATTQTAKQTPAPNSDETRRISIQETQAAITAGTALVVDVRGAADYQASHVKGAKSIPLQQFNERTGELPKDKLIITYCAWPAEQTSARAVQMLKAKGNTNAAAMTGGWNAWTAAKLPVESAQ